MKTPPQEPDGRAWADLIELSRTLRSPEGCPWDRAQTLRTLVPFLVEESFEVLEAVERGDRTATSEEIGDLAFVLSLVGVTGEGEGLPSPAAILARAREKIRGRHPHVFELDGDADRGPGDTGDISSPEPHAKADASITPSQVVREWDKRKAKQERNDEDRLPALLRARKIQERAAALGFDWPTAEATLDKVREELEEVAVALREANGHASPKGSATRQALREELGDLLFSVVNLARKCEMDAEAALREGNRKFRRRFDRMLERLESRGIDPATADLATMDAEWDAAKTELRNRRDAGSED